MAKFGITLNGTEMWLSAAQIDKLLKALEGATSVDTKYVGTSKGWYGSDCQYEATFGTFDPSKHVGGLRLISQETLDKYLTLQAMRDNDITPTN